MLNCQEEDHTEEKYVVDWEMDYDPATSFEEKLQVIDEIFFKPTRISMMEENIARVDKELTELRKPRVKRIVELEKRRADLEEELNAMQ